MPTPLQQSRDRHDERKRAANTTIIIPRTEATIGIALRRKFERKYTP
jgi:hypothetical protein